MLSLLENITGIIHVGAHRGEELDSYYNLGAKNLIMIEPNPEVFQEMQDLISNRNYDIDIKTFMIACDNKISEEDLHLIYGPDAGYMVGNKGCSSFLKPISNRLKEWYKNTIKVKTISLDTLFEDNNLIFKDYQFLNIDVQGAELRVLEGAQKVLQNVNYINIEVTWNNFDYENNSTLAEVENFISSLGFTMVKLEKMTSDWGDALFKRK